MLSRSLLLCLGVTSLAGCVGKVSDANDTHPWKLEQGSYQVADNPSNVAAGNVAQIQVLWVPPGQSRENSQIVWEAVPSEDLPYAGFSFHVFHPSPLLHVVIDSSHRLPKNGEYYVCVKTDGSRDYQLFDEVDYNTLLTMQTAGVDARSL